MVQEDEVVRTTLIDVFKRSKTNQLLQRCCDAQLHENAQAKMGEANAIGRKMMTALTPPVIRGMADDGTNQYLTDDTRIYKILHTFISLTMSDEVHESDQLSRNTLVQGSLFKPTWQRALPR